MAREHPEEKAKEQVIEREVTLSLINAKLNELMSMVLEIAKKKGVSTNEED